MKMELKNPASQLETLKESLPRLVNQAKDRIAGLVMKVEIEGT